MRPDSVGLGGFDSHAFPPRAARANGRFVRFIRYLGCGAFAVVLPITNATAQLPKPPISPARAFVTSALVPGLAQAKLGRSTGILFATVEAMALAMYGKSHHDLT